MTRRSAVVRLAVVVAIAAGAVGAPGAPSLVPAAPAPRTEPATTSAPQHISDSVRSREYWLAQSGVPDAWAVTRGAGVTIAIIDTGVDGTVAELQGAVIRGTDLSGQGSPNGQTPVGSSGAHHGTMVGSLAAGRGTGSNAGVIGTAPEASLLSISIGFDDESDSDQQIADAVRWATDNGADVINMSLTRNTLDWPESWDDAFLYAMDHDVVIVAAAGNRGSGTDEVGAPATMPGVLTVAGVGKSGMSSVRASAQGITIGVAAASENLVGVVPGGAHVTWNGTSGASPIVAGIVALVRAAHPDLDAANVIQRVVSTATDKGPPGADFSYGYGIVNAAAAVSAEVAEVDENPMGDLHEWVRINRRASPSPAPTLTISPTPAPGTVAGPELLATPGAIVDALVPSLALLQLVGVPLLAGSAIAFVWIGFGVGAYRYFSWLRRRQ